MIVDCDQWDVQIVFIITMVVDRTRNMDQKFLHVIVGTYVRKHLDDGRFASVYCMINDVCKGSRSLYIKYGAYQASCGILLKLKS